MFLVDKDNRARFGPIAPTFVAYPLIAYLAILFGVAEHPLGLNSFLPTYLATMAYLIVILALLAGAVSCVTESLRLHKLTLIHFPRTAVKATLVHLIGLSIMALLLNIRLLLDPLWRI